MDSAESEWSKEKPSPDTSYLTRMDKLEEVYLNDPENDNEDIYSEVVQASTPWAHESKATITAPRQAYFPDKKKSLPGFKSQITGTTNSAEPDLPNEQIPSLYTPTHIGKNKSEALDKTKNNGRDSSDKAALTSTWWSNRWSTRWAHAFGATNPVPNQHDESSLENPENLHSPQKGVSNQTLTDHDHNTSLTGRKGNNGFDKTKTLLASHLRDRIACMNGNKCRTDTQSSYSEDLTQDSAQIYEEGAEAFIAWAKKLILESEGPNRRVDDWMIMGFIDATFLQAEIGEKKPRLYGEWDYLWAMERDDVVGDETRVFGEGARSSGLRSSRVLRIGNGGLGSGGKCRGLFGSGNRERRFGRGNGDIV
ncbi:hypothetical protein SBOR_4969 [Sclerotinia borealis F-4128]|uniref:Uncharacterized protein n=1 Tax=Sclerotinia borealis (strain F-4128) TaxID=1432307 RepID=W9CJF3_SCLBF|nr:hypothetical protein SBOR_4969 [Sclerotinia borealis F-4128]